MLALLQKLLVTVWVFAGVVWVSWTLPASLALAVAGLLLLTLGHVDWGLLGALLLGSLPGIWLGARLTKAMPDGLVRGVLCVSLVAAGAKVLN